MNQHIAHTAETLLQNLDVSIVMPFYRKYEEFSRTLLVNSGYFQRNGIEVIICMDDPEGEAEVLALTGQYPFINWKIMINRQPHAWRNPSKTINVGIRHASREYVLVMGPDSEMHTDVILQLRYLLEVQPKAYALGQVLFADHDLRLAGSRDKHVFMPYGSIMASTKAFIEAGGYDESYTEWGGDDDNIRARLDLLGYRRLLSGDALLIHREKKGVIHDGGKERAEKSRRLSSEMMRNILYPEAAVVNAPSWGNDFSECIYNYGDRNAESQCLKYLQRFEQYAVMKKDAFEKQYRIIALVPAFNEQKHMPALLEHLDGHCDGIILLDDGSEDATFEKAVSDKLLLKVKKSRTAFDELHVRNTLLDLASFFRSDWFFFMDADERFDERYADLHAVCEMPGPDAYCFYLVHLWNDMERYRTDVPELSPVSEPGVLHRWRMFRNKGHMQIADSSNIHIKATPYFTEKHIAPILVLHLGMMEDAERKRKYNLYRKEDKALPDAPAKYDYFLDEEVRTNRLDELPTLNIINFSGIKNK